MSEYSLPAIQALYELYADLATEVATYQKDCKACGRCCRFDEMDHVLFATQLEIDALIAADGYREPTLEGRCPYQQESECLARRGRPLGCRLFYCNTEFETELTLEELSSRYHKRLKDLHKRHNIPWQYGPFLRLLADSNSDC